MKNSWGESPFLFSKEKLGRVPIISSLNIWLNSPMKQSRLLFFLGRFLITNTIPLIETQLFRFLLVLVLAFMFLKEFGLRKDILYFQPPYPKFEEYWEKIHSKNNCPGIMDISGREVFFFSDDSKVKYE